MSAAYEVYAIKYAHHERTAAQNFLGGDPHDGPMPMDYFIWLVRGQGLEIVVDTGFGAATAARRTPPAAAAAPSGSGACAA